MTATPGAEDVPRAATEEDRDRGQDPLGGLRQLEHRALLAWVGDNLTEVRRTASGQRPVYWILALGVVVGVAAHVGGYALRTSTTDEPLGLIADLLYALGFALWTGVIVVVFVQIVPEAKRRQYKEALDAYEAALREDRQEPATGEPPA